MMHVKTNIECMQGVNESQYEMSYTPYWNAYEGR
jgi:hypothetical protein